MGLAEVTTVFNKVTRVTPAQKIILLALADRADGRGVAWPSIRELAHRSCQSRRSVHRHLSQLKAIGIISMRPRYFFNERTGTKRRTSSEFHLDLFGITQGKYLANEENDSPSSGAVCQSDTGVSPAEIEFDECEIPSDDDSYWSGAECQSDTGEDERQGLCATVGTQPYDTGGTPRTSIEEQSTLLPPTPSSEGVSRDTSGDTEGGAADAAEENSHSLSDEDWVTLHAVLPEPMLAGLTPQGRLKVLELIEKRREAGWTTADMRRLLNARALPPQVKTMVGLVVARFRSDIPLDGAPPSKQELAEKEQAIREKKIAERDAFLEKQARERQEQEERERRERQSRPAVRHPNPLKKRNLRGRNAKF